jgi:hypothetical protein
MSDEPFPFNPEQIEPRAESHACADRETPILSANDAKLAAFYRLVAWREAHPNG